MGMTDDTIKSANRRAANKRAAFPAAVSVRYDRRVGRIVITLISGLELAFAPKLVEGLECVHPEDLLDAEITPSGLGLHFPRVDVDLYLRALLEGLLGSMRWTAAQPEVDPVIANSLTFLAEDMQRYPRRIEAMDSSLRDRLDSLVGNVDVDLDAGLSSEND